MNNAAMASAVTQPATNNTVPTQTESAASNRAPIGIGDRGIELKTFDDVWRFANMMLEAGFPPKDMNTIPKVAAAIHYGMAVGIPPAMAAMHIAVINGRPTLWGDMVLALCMSKPCFDHNAFKEWFTGEPMTDEWTAHCRVRRVGTEGPVEEEFSVADAKRAGLWNKRGRDGHPTPWVTYVKRMMKMRPRSYVLRDNFADVLQGLYVREEMQSIDDIMGQIAMPEETETETETRARLTAPTPGGGETPQAANEKPAPSASPPPNEHTSEAGEAPTAQSDAPQPANPSPAMTAPADVMPPPDGREPESPASLEKPRRRRRRMTKGGAQAPNGSTAPPEAVEPAPSETATDTAPAAPSQQELIDLRADVLRKYNRGIVHPATATAVTQSLKDHGIKAIELPTFSDAEALRAASRQITERTGIE